MNRESNWVEFPAANHAQWFWCILYSSGSNNRGRRKTPLPLAQGAGPTE